MRPGLQAGSTAEWEEARIDQVATEVAELPRRRWPIARGGEAGGGGSQQRAGVLSVATLQTAWIELRSNEAKRADPEQIAK